MSTVYVRTPWNVDNYQAGNGLPVVTKAGIAIDSSLLSALMLAAGLNNVRLETSTQPFKSNLVATPAVQQFIDDTQVSDFSTYSSTKIVALINAAIAAGVGSTGGTGGTGGSGGSGTKTYPAGATVPVGWGSRWLPALAAAKAGTGKAKIAIMGDSIASMFKAANPATSWAGLTRAALQTYATDGGSGWTGVSLSPLVSGTYGDNSMYPVTFTGTWNYLSHQDGPGMVNAYSGNNTDKATFGSIRGTTIKVYVTSNLAGLNFRVKVDGGTAQNFVTAGSFAITEATLTTVASGSHSVEVSSPDTASAAFLIVYGVAAENSNGVVIDNYAMSATTSGQWAGGGDLPTGNPPAKWSGGPSRPADLLIYALGVNDAAGIVGGPGGSATTASAYITNITNTMARVTAGLSTGPDVVFFLPAIGSFQGSGADWGQMKTALSTYAAANGNAVVFMDATVPTFAAGAAINYWAYADASMPGASGTDGVHPSNSGHLLMKQIIYPVLTP